ncbi:hypothetical protein [Alkalihalobacterium sp. APHAB7]|uniref:hypothetical protein n=1 Tax=Alkalihalobacterium sp. APHAB7 TaxID=3402081 RepID=UPI003AAE2683
MKKGIRLIMTVLFGVLLLGGCGTAEQVDPIEESRGSQPQEKQTQDGESAESSSNDQQEEQKDNEEQMDQSEEKSNEKKLTYRIEGELYEETAFLRKSDNQNFSMYIYDKYELEAEEPRKDVVISKEDGNVFMRIEVLPTDVDLSKVEADIPMRAKAVSDEYFHNETALMSDFLEGSVWYKAYTEKFAVSVILVKSKEQPIILTIHTPREKEVLPPFIVMAETIK